MSLSWQHGPCLPLQQHLAGTRVHHGLFRWKLDSIRTMSWGVFSRSRVNTGTNRQAKLLEAAADDDSFDLAEFNLRLALYLAAACQ